MNFYLVSGFLRLIIPELLTTILSTHGTTTKWRKVVSQTVKTITKKNS